MPPTSGFDTPPKAPERIDTARLLLHRVSLDDADAIFSTYAADPEVTRYVGFPRHRSIDDTRAFVAWADAQWTESPSGPYLVRLRGSNALLGSTGLVFETPFRAATGYVLAKAAWGHGYATEALAAMTAVAKNCGVKRLYALCHHAHRPSARVLEKGGFALEGVLRRYAEFPNLAPGVPDDCLCYARIF
jgi:RimJ/RimL family protein N-acetyltransferase